MRRVNPELPRVWRTENAPSRLQRTPAAVANRAYSLFFRAPTGDGPAKASGSLSRRSRLEAILFESRRPLGLRKLAQLANLADGTEVRTLLGQIRTTYEARGSAFQVEQVAGGYQLLTRPQFATWLRPIAGGEPELRLSPPALETLAVVAYRQPVLRAEVEAIRGVGCGEILRLLMEHDLLRIVGRSEELGRPLSYGTTKRFLEVFGLRDLDELPWGDQLRSKGMIAPSVEGPSASAASSPAAGGRMAA